MLLVVIFEAVAAYALLYAGLSGTTAWRHPWQPLVAGIGGRASVKTSAA